MRKTLIVSATAAALSLGLTAPAMAAPGDTTTTFTLTGGSLLITVPATADLGPDLTGVAAAAGQLGAVTVTDARGTTAGWGASVANGGFTSLQNLGLPIAAADVAYSPGSPTATTGVAIFTPGAAGAIGAGIGALTATAASGNNSATWNPTISVSVPAAALVGAYTGSITHSVL